MSRSELSFALNVEEMLHHISQPERRQIVVELLCIVATILSRNPELRFQQVLDLDQLLLDSFNMYQRVNYFILVSNSHLTHCFHLKDHNLPQSDDLTLLFTLSYSQSTGYLARAAVNSVLQRGALATQDLAEDVEEYCRVS